MSKFRQAANKIGAAERAAKYAAIEGHQKLGTSSIEISISCRNLVNKDELSKSDPVCIIYHQPDVLNRKKEWVELKKTELIENNLNPDFATKLQMEYRFEHLQLLRFHLYDIDSLTDPISDDDSLGYADCTVGKIVAAGARGHVQELEPIENVEDGPLSYGTIILIAEEIDASKDEVYWELSGLSLGSCTTCFNVRSFYDVSRINDVGTYLIAHRCQLVRGSNPIWSPLKIPGRSLCYGEWDRSLKIQVWRKNLRNEDQLVGFCLTTVNKMMSQKGDMLPLQTSDGNKTGSYISIINCSITPIFTFMHYVQAGTRLHLCFSIDFTMSNGDYTKPESLHYISDDPKKANPYQQALEATGFIMKDYDEDNIFPVFGFGGSRNIKCDPFLDGFQVAKIPPLGKVSHNFPITLGESPNCEGIDGVLQAYKNCVKRIELFGPTHFSPVINIVNEWAEKCEPGHDYFILVMLTDGSIEDMTRTKQAIIKASTLPISIIIVGIGEADFSSMNELDGDQGAIYYMGETATRDVVQFVEYRSADSWLRRMGEKTADTKNMAGVAMTAMAENQKNKGNSDSMAAKGRLVQEILREIPEQIQAYMASKGINPDMIFKSTSQNKANSTRKIQDEPQQQQQ